MVNFLKYRKAYYIFSATLVLASLLCLFIFGLNPGIEFTGGSVLELEYLKERPAVPQIRRALQEFDLGGVFVQPIGEQGILLRLKEIDETMHQQILEKLKESRGETPEPVAQFLETNVGKEKAEQILEGQTEPVALRELRFESIGPSIGKELVQKTKWMLVLTLISILIYIAWAFRKVSRPCRSWQYGLFALLVLFHDVLIPLGVFSVLGKFYGFQITIPIITALLTILGYSVNDTVIIFDRVRENLLKARSLDFSQTVNTALNQTLGRSLSTSLTTLFVLFAIFFFGGETIRDFSLTLILGITAGSYSSIFLAAPFLITWQNWRRR